MKRIFTLALALMLLLSLVPASAQSKDSFKVTPNREFRFPDPGTPFTGFTINNTSDHDLEFTVTVVDEDTRSKVDTQVFTVPMGETAYPVTVYVYKYLEKDQELNTYMYTIKTKGGAVQYFKFAQKLTIKKEGSGLVHFYDQYYSPAYPRNTVSSFGPHFRDVTPALTDKWYMFTPVDLTIQGRQVFPLVASNIYEVGEVYVDVNQDTVVVSYRMFHEGKRNYSTKQLSEFITFYKSYADVGIVEPEDMKEPSMFAFGQPISILNHFGGDTNVLLFIRNRITYYGHPTPKTQYVRFWENKPEYKQRREAMLMMMDPIVPPADK